MKFSKISYLIIPCVIVCFLYVLTTGQYEFYTAWLYFFGIMELIEFYISDGMSGPVVLNVNQGIIGFSKYKIKEYHISLANKKITKLNFSSF
jgi:hypothetical protein